MALISNDVMPSADLVVGSARIPVSVIDITEQGAAVELNGNVQDFAGASLHVHGIGHLPISLHRHMQGKVHVFGFSKPTLRTQKRLSDELEDQEDLIGPAIDYILNRREIS